jgi:methionine-S-sulfoxide reductase
MNKALFGMGCFWGPDDFLSKLNGVIKTTVGYSGGKKENPTYHDLGNHTETVEIKFNPKIITYSKLLNYFFVKHDPSFETKTQYRSMVFYFNNDQKKLAQAALKKYNQENKIKAKTQIEKAGKFWSAEEYHQKYYQKNNVSGIC